MPDFELRVTGATLETWDGSEVVPSRLNPRGGRSMHHYVAQVGDTVTLTASLDGVEAPLDSELDGKLFFASTAQRPQAAKWEPAWSSPAGQSSVQSFQVEYLGIYTVYMRHVDGGSVFVNLNVEPAP